MTGRLLYPFLTPLLTHNKTEFSYHFFPNSHRFRIGSRRTSLETHTSGDPTRKKKTPRVMEPPPDYKSALGDCRDSSVDVQYLST